MTTFNKGETVRIAPDFGNPDFAGKVGTVVEFDGSNVYVQVPYLDWTVMSGTPGVGAFGLHHVQKVDRSELPVEEAYPIGSVWNHRSYRDERFTILRHADHDQLEVSNSIPLWPRSALDRFGTLVEAAPETDEVEELDLRLYKAEIEIANLQGDIRAYSDNAAMQDETIADLRKQVASLIDQFTESQTALHFAEEDLERHMALRAYVQRELLDSHELALVAGFTQGWSARVGEEV